MNSEELAYWAAFVIPLILLLMSGFIRKLVDAQDFKREHWYLGIDLTIYFLASTLINFLDIAKAGRYNVRAVSWTALLVAAAVVFLVVQAGLQQSWAPKQRSRMQVLVLCGFANVLGTLLLYVFVLLKGKGLI